MIESPMAGKPRQRRLVTDGTETETRIKTRGIRLKKVREHMRDQGGHKVPQDLVAFLLGEGVDTIRGWEQGRWSPRTEDLERLADLYGVPVDVLLSDGPIPASDPQRVKIAYVLAVNPLANADDDLTEVGRKKISEINADHRKRREPKRGDG